MRGPLDLSRVLLEADVLHEILHLRRRIDDADELPEVLGVPADACVRVRLYDADDRLVAVLLPAGLVPSTTALAKAAGAAQLDATDPARVSAVTDFHPSLVSPLGLPPDVLTVADAAFALTDVVYAPTGDGSTALKIRTRDLLELTGARFATLVEPGAQVAVPSGEWLA